MRFDPTYGTKGLMARGFGWTKSVFVSGQTGRDLADSTYKVLTDKMYSDGAEIVGHTISTDTDSRTMVNNGLQTLSQYQARNWIDHGGMTGFGNLEDIHSQGSLKGSEYYILDILDSYNYNFAWSYIDIPIPLANYSPNLLYPIGTRLIRPFFFYNNNVDDNPSDNTKIYLWSTISTRGRANIVYTTTNVDNLISERGVSIGHDYLALTDNNNHTWYTNPNTNKKEIYPDFDNELAYMQSKRDAGLLWNPTMATFGDYLILLLNVSIVNNADGTYTVINNNTKPINGLTLLAESDIESVTIDGEELATFGGNLGSKEIVIPSIDAGDSVTLAVSLIN